MEGSSPIGDRSGRRSAVKLAGGLAACQHGTVARWQLLERGISRAQVRSWLRSGRLHRHHPGVYAFGRPDLSTEGELAAALLYGGPGSALGGLTALWWMDLLGRRPRSIHVDALGRRVGQPGLVLRRVTTLQRAWTRGLPVNPLPQALLAAASDLDHDSLRLVLARADFKRILDLGVLQTALGGGRSGSSAVRAALTAHLPQLGHCVNPLETAFVCSASATGCRSPSRIQGSAATTPTCCGAIDG